MATSIMRKIEPQPECLVDGSNDGWWLYKEKIHTGVNMADVLMDEYADDPEYEGLKPVIVDDIWYWQSTPVLRSPQTGSTFSSRFTYPIHPHGPGYHDGSRVDGGKKKIMNKCDHNTGFDVIRCTYGCGVFVNVISTETKQVVDRLTTYIAPWATNAPALGNAYYWRWDDLNNSTPAIAPAL